MAPSQLFHIIQLLMYSFVIQLMQLSKVLFLVMSNMGLRMVTIHESQNDGH